MKRIIINKKLVADEIQRFLGPVDLNDETMTKLFKIATIDKVKKHAMILTPGDSSDYIGLVLKGMVQIYHYLDNKLVSDFFAGEGCGFFDVESFLNDAPSNVSIEALEPSVIAKFDKKQFLELCAEDDRIDHIYQKILQYGIIMTNQRLDSLLHDSAEDKYISLENRMPGLTSRISSINISSYIGVTQETLCRIKSKQGILF